MIRMTNKALTSNYTEVYHDKPEFHAPHYFQVRDKSNRILLTEVQFQKGPIKDYGINGCHNEDLICMVIQRLEGFQNSPYICDENAKALEYLYEALRELRKRTDKRIARGVEGTRDI